ncbi:sensor histidine kinase [Streptomyces oryzae]|uniref:histidine kinase n=1 Tax=Streptomyces oryzae TaxID=1434886 RepID=A0ABS3XI62_9ACTN|nr:sensor histidine kinase [Streptomyces oryzae]MBO8195093.1 sensor histidine kinase [Streptomyces oryzae]
MRRVSYGRPLTIAYRAWQALREELFRVEGGSEGGAGWRIWQPTVVLALSLAAFVLGVFNIGMLTSDGFGGFGTTEAVLLGGGQAAALVLAAFRPVTSWWVVTGTMVVIAVVMGVSPPPWFRESPWTAPGVACQAGVLLLVAVRRRPRAALGALLLSVVSTVLCGLVMHQFSGPSAFRNMPTDFLVLALAVVVGSALFGRQAARSELVVQEEKTAQERTRRTLLEERNRIARELHDVVAHHMSVISIQAQAAPHLVENPSEELKESLAGIRQHAVEALAELRRVLGVLRSEDALDDDRHAPQPTLEGLPELVANVRAAGPPVTTRTVGEPRPLPPGMEVSAYRIVQEALSNVLRHAPGAAAEVEIGYHPTELTVRVTNTAPDPTAPAMPSRGAGHGLPGMRERAAMLDGTLWCGATADGGWSVTASLPVPSPAETPTRTTPTTRTTRTTRSAQSPLTIEDPS